MDLSKYLENANDALKRRNFSLAVRIYHQVLQIQPDFGEARAALRKALFQKVAQKPASKLTAVLLGGFSAMSASIARLVGKHAAAARSLERYLVHDPMSENANEPDCSSKLPNTPG